MDPLLYNFLSELDANSDKKRVVIAMGGNALNLLNVKDGTKDVDICVFVPDADVIDFARVYSRRTKVRVDVFLDGWVQPVRFPDMLQRASHTGSPFSNIELFTMNLYDMILTKVDRWSEKDKADIGSALNKIPCSKREMEERYTFILSQFYDNLHETFRTNYTQFLNELGFLLK
ncbi:MAG: DUF6036 family nucleotidyltransferase [bacterium]|nr:DUF6036 family nucleotidyltransferase [bacterium]